MPVDLGLEGKTVLVTGASRGIGAASARLLAAAGAYVVLHSRAEEASRIDAEAVAADIVARGGKAQLVTGDVTNEEDIRRFVEEAGHTAGRLDVLVNNAGALGGRFPIDEVDAGAFDRVARLNAFAPLAVLRAARPFFRRGSVVNVSSIAALTGGGPGASLYAGAKAFVEAATRSLSKELAPEIRVNAIAPGPVDSAFHADRSRLDALGPGIPLKRVGLPEDIAQAVLFFASEVQSGWITGQVLDVNGGVGLRT